MVISAHHNWYDTDGNNIKYFFNHAIMRLGPQKDGNWEISFKLHAYDLLRAVLNEDEPMKHDSYRDIVVARLPEKDMQGEPLLEKVKSLMARASKEKKMT